MKNSLLSAKAIILMIALICTFSFSINAQITNTTHPANSPYLTIQLAIDDAITVAGDVIELSPGTYTEAITVNKSIHLKGQAGQVLATFIKAPASLPLAATGNSNIITVTGTGVNAEINDITIAGPGPSTCGSIGSGIFVRNGANANIHDNRIIDVRDNPFSGCQNGVAIQVGRNSLSTTGTATITNNIITGYQKNGITVDNTGSGATITGNTITGIGTTAIIAQNGIQVSRGATATLSGNIVSDNSFHLTANPSDWGSTGILLFESGAVTLNGGNNLSGNDQNLYVYNPTGTVALGAEIFGTSSAPLGFGNQIANLSNQNLDARNSTFGGVSTGALTMTQLFTLEDFIFHTIDNPTLGFVYVKTNNDFVTTRSFDTDSGYPDAQIQRGIDAASAGFIVNVQSGGYAKQIAVNRSVFGVNGPHQFGLFVDKDNLTIKGYDVSDASVASASTAAVVFTTGATNNFGSSGIFVQANGVSLEGLKVGNNLNASNANDNNKTLEIIGDAFSMTKCWINPSSDEGAVYMGRWDALHPISSYTLTGNKFENTLVSINNGVGLSGPRTGRVITNNEFVGVATPYLIGFRGWNGAGPVQGWIVDPVGGAVVTGNLFNTTGVDKYVVTRGNAGGYINSELIWADIWNLNTYGNHVVSLVNFPTFDVRSYTDGTGYTETRSISPLIQENIDIAQTADVVLVSTGTYNENPNINKSLTLRGAQANNCAAARTGAESIINCVSGIGVNASNVTINGFTIQGQTDPNAAPGFGYAVYMAPTKTGTQLINNIIKNNIVGSSVSNGGASPSQVLISCNWFDANNNPGSASGAGIYTDEYVSGGVISNVLIDKNKFSGNNDAGIDFSTTTAINASTGITITNNDFDGNNRAAFLFNIVSSSFNNNVIHNSTGVGSGEVRIYGGVDNLQIKNNSFTAGGPHAIRITDDGGTSSNITVFENSFVGYSNSNLAVEIVSGYTGTLAATCNWWNTTSPAAIASQITGATSYIPYLNNGTDNSPATGFQPVPNSCTGGIPKLTASINGVVVNANNDGNNDTGSFSVCNTTNNILFNAYTDQDGLADPLLKVYQTYTVSNVTVPFCNNCSAAMALFAGATGTAALSDASSPGTLTMTFRSWIDTNNDGNVDPSEPVSDLIVYTITVNPLPTVSFIIGGSPVASINNGVADPSESATVSVCDGGTYTVSNLVNSSTSNRYIVNATPSGGGLLFNGSPAGNADISAAEFSAVVGPIYTITLSNPSVGGSVVQVITPYNDANASGSYDAGECKGDPVTITYIANPIPNAIANPPAQTVCSGATITTIALTGGITGTTFTWTRDNTATVTGIAASGSGDISGLLTNTTISPVTVTFTITPKTANCTGTSITATVLVQGKITITAPTVTQPTCAIPGGKIVVNATSGSTLEYSVDGGANWQLTNTFSGLAAGNYYISVRLQGSSPECPVVYNSIPIVLVAATGCTNCVLSCPGNISVCNKKGVCGAYVNYWVAKTGSCGTITYSKASGSLFPIGTTLVTVTSSTGKSCSFSITVVDKEKPDIICPADITAVAAVNTCSKVVTFTVTAKDNCPGVTVTTVPASGSTFPIGSTKVTATATDASGNKTTSTFTVKVKETQAPVINIAANPIVLLWPANGSYQTINMSQLVTSVTDNCGSIAVSNVKIMKVTSDEAENAVGDADGNTIKDIKIADNCKSVELRRERKSTGNGRVYTIYLSVSDASGNTGTATFKVIAPITQTGTSAVADAAAYTVNSNCSGYNYYYKPDAATTTELIIVKNEIPEGFMMEQNYPNPFNGVTIIRYAIPVEAQVSLGVYNQLGQRIAQLTEGRMSAGYHQTRFDGSKLAAGIYLYWMLAIGPDGKPVVISKKMMVAK